MDPTPRHSITSFMKKVTESSSLQKQFQENDKYFQTKLQVARFSKNEMFKKNPPAVYAGKDKLGRAVFYITGLLIPDSGKPEYEVWIQHFVTLIDERLGDKPYLIVFFNTNLMTHSRLSDFKELMG
jgi:Rho GTPase-activating protein 1